MMGINGSIGTSIHTIQRFNHHPLPIFTPRWRLNDIDTKDDLARADYPFSQIKDIINV